MAIITKVGLFPSLSVGIIIIFNILAGLALNSFSILGASFFKKAQLSGITVIVITLILGVVAQITAKSLSTGAVAILSLLFTPMTFVFFFIFMARFEHLQLHTNLIKAAPGATWRLPGIVFWIFLIVQIFVYPILGALAERCLYGTASKRGRTVVFRETTTPVTLMNFTKHYYPNWFYQVIAPLLGFKKSPVVAVNDLSLSAMKGQIMVLVGANGCGKSTTLVSLPNWT